MMAGHFGLAAAVKARVPEVPLWSLMLATAWLDIVFVPLLIMEIEGFEMLPGAESAYGNLIIHAPYTHSLLGALLLSGIFGSVAGWRWGFRAGLVLAGVAFSHWLLDLLVHHPDMPFLPGNAFDLPLMGLGLWRFPLLTMAVEAALVVGGAFLYWRAAERVTGPHRGIVSPVLVAGLIALSGLALLVPSILEL